MSKYKIGQPDGSTASINVDHPVNCCGPVNIAAGVIKSISDEDGPCSQSLNAVQPERVETNVTVSVNPATAEPCDKTTPNSEQIQQDKHSAPASHP